MSDGIVSWAKMKRKRDFLAKLRTNGAYYTTGGLILLLGIPLYQLLVLIPHGYSDALAQASNGNFSAYLFWIGHHGGQFAGYRALLMIAFALLVSLPFTLFRIIVAQEILGREEEVEEVSAIEEGQQAQKESEADEEEESPIEEGQQAQKEKESEAAVEGNEEQEPGSMPAFAWRGKGYAVVAAWAGLFGILLFVLGTLASTIYLYFLGAPFGASASYNVSAMNCTPACTSLAGTFTIIANTAGGGLLALSCLFFGAVIARSGRSLWPGIWVAFGYTALAIAAVMSGSAVEIASASTTGQAALTTPAILLFAIWVLWFGIMLIRLKPE